MLLEQINACAVLPGRRPQLDFPAGIIRKVSTNSAPRFFCEFPAHVVPESPFDVALDLGFNNPHGLHPNKDHSGSDPHFQLSINSPKREVTTSGSDSAIPVLPFVDAWNEEATARGSLAPGLKDSESRQCSYGPCNRVLEPGSRDVNEVVLGCIPEIDEKVDHLVSLHVDGDAMVGPVLGEGRVSKCTGTETVGVPVSPLHLTPVNFISASYYVERPSKPEPFSSAISTTRRTSFCRIEAFVIRSRSVKAAPMQQQQSFKKTAAKSVSVDME